MKRKEGSYCTAHSSSATSRPPGNLWCTIAQCLSTGILWKGASHAWQLSRHIFFSYSRYNRRGKAFRLLQRDAVVGHAEAIRTQSRKPSKAHTHKKRQPTNAGQPHSGFLHIAASSGSHCTVTLHHNPQQHSTARTLKAL